jgi:hypothetical protein
MRCGRIGFAIFFFSLFLNVHGRKFFGRTNARLWAFGEAKQKFWAGFFLFSRPHTSAVEICLSTNFLMCNLNNHQGKYTNCQDNVIFLELLKTQ